VDRANAGSAIGEELLCCAQDLFTWWYRVRDGTLSRSTFRQYLAVVRSMVREQLEAGAACGCAKTAGVCRELLTVEPALWTFVRVQGVEPTNNAAERALRHAVLWRKNHTRRRLARLHAHGDRGRALRGLVGAQGPKLMGRGRPTTCAAA
jgi:transposase